jgi:cell shape-determining protein MreC
MIPPAYARRLLPTTLVLLAVLTFTPIKYTAWAGWFGRLTQTIVAPISHTLAAVSRWLAPATLQALDPEEILTLRQETEARKAQLNHALEENNRLHALIRELQRGNALDPNLAVHQMYAPVFGSASDLSSGLLSVRAGRQQGVNESTVAMAMGLQLLGRVTSVGELTCTVAPITSKASGPLIAKIVLDDFGAGLGCTLAAAGDGTLQGDVEDRRNPATTTAIEPSVGQEVRLNDPSWPRSAQMLLIGKVEKVEPSPKQPLRKVVTVRPIVENLDRVSEVMLRMTLADASPRNAAEQSR